MPVFRGITVTVHTPFAIDGLPETPLPALHGPSPIVEEENKYAPVFVPAHAQSLFWLSYFVEPPVDDTFFVFKLFINKKHIVTWSCDKDEGWRGKVQFALFKQSEGDEVLGGVGMEKRALQFGHVSHGHDEDRSVEVRVLRATAKFRMPRQLVEGKNITVGSGVQLPEAGKTKRGHPRKYYQFKLVDPKDDPYATFRFYYRTHEEVSSLDRHINRGPSSDRVVTAPGRTTTIRQVPAGKLIKAQGIRKVSQLPQAAYRMPSSSSSLNELPVSPAAPAHPPPAIPRSTGQVNLRRLSIPPITILPPLLEHGPLPVSPTKQIEHDGSPRAGQQFGKAKRENASTRLRSLFQGSKARKDSKDEPA